MNRFGLPPIVVHVLGIILAVATLLAGNATFKHLVGQDGIDITQLIVTILVYLGVTQISANSTEPPK